MNAAAVHERAGRLHRHAAIVDQRRHRRVHASATADVTGEGPQVLERPVVAAAHAEDSPCDGPGATEAAARTVQANVVQAHLAERAAQVG